MVRLEDIRPGCVISGMDVRPVTIVATQSYGSAVLSVTYKDHNGNLNDRLLYREDEASLSCQESSALPWSFEADGSLLRLASEAWRIAYAWLFDPYLAVHTSDIEPLPHQISAVYQEMLGRIPLRYILADDPGAGKTIMTGLLIKELQARGDCKRCLVVSPGSLAEQWQDELFHKFHLHFEIFGSDLLNNAATGNAFAEVDCGIARLDKLARNEDVQNMLKATDWDLIVVDEAHKLSATVSGGVVKATRRFQLGRLLSNITRHFLLLTATPHNGKEEDFQLFLSLVDQDRFGGVARTGAQAINVSDIMRRLVKEELLKFDGSPLFPERHAVTVNYDLSPLEAELYQAVTSYVQNEFNRADNLNKERRTTVGFALTVLQRRLASSPEAIYQSLHRRRERLQERLQEERLDSRARTSGYSQETLLSLMEDEDEYTDREIESVEDEVTDAASASQTMEELEAEIATLADLEALADKVRMSGTDRKWEELSGLLQDDHAMRDARGNREKVIVFTEHRDTLRYLKERIVSLLGTAQAVVHIDGAMLRTERRKVEELFRQDKDVVVLIATDAAGEGLNLQRAHLMVNYDLPWNPNRLEQRFGRIHRIGQTRPCWLYNLVASETREGHVFKTLFAKLEQEKRDLGGRVFDILGKVSFENRPLRDLLIEAIRHGSEQGVQSQLEDRINTALGSQELHKLLAAHALTDDLMDAQTVASIREDMERMEARRLQPFFIESFFKEAFRFLGGRMSAREKGRYEISHVPGVLRRHDMAVGTREPVLQRYERICFDKKFRAGAVPATFVCPGHPLMDALLSVVRERLSPLLHQGAVLVDEEDSGDSARLLFYIEHSVTDGVQMPDGSRRLISRRFHFVEIAEDGSAHGAGYAPYLDYRPASKAEQQAALAYAAGCSMLGTDAENRALTHAATALIPRHVQEVRTRRLALVDKTARAVKARLTAEIQHWDYQAAELRLREQAGKRNAALNAQQAERRAEELSVRLQTRLAELEAERNISAKPPRIVGGCLVMPAGLLARLMGIPEDETDAGAYCRNAQSRKAIELAAMQAVMQLERSLGFVPRDVSAEKCGYDIESIASGATDDAVSHMRFIEVKGRHKDAAETVTVTRNEHLTALNRPDNYILAIVSVDGNRVHVTYLTRAISANPDFASINTNFSVSLLRQSAKEVFEQDILLSKDTGFHIPP